MISFFDKTKISLQKTRKNLKNLFLSFHEKSILEDSDLESIEEILFTSDIGYELTEIILDELKKADFKEYSLEERFQKCINDYLGINNKQSKLKRVIILVGVNGTGKTTSVAKLAGYFKGLNEKISLVAADTYRAAAVEQIQIWADTLNLDLISNTKSDDPASVAFDGVYSGINKGHDRIIVDTSGRIHTSPNLMKELEKIYRVIQKLTKEVDVLITVDANTGQNAFKQVKEFYKYIPLTGIILTKMDGTAKGGIVIQIMKELDIPVYFLGFGEKVEDLVLFDQKNYIRSLISN